MGKYSKRNKIDKIIVSSQSFYLIDNGDEIGGYVPSKAPDNRMIIADNGIKAQTGTIIHEASHLLDDKKKFNISNSKQYIEACMSDSQKLRDNGIDVHISSDTKMFAGKVIDNDEGAIKRPLSEDFATSVTKYLENPEEFTEKYPGRAEIIESVLDGNFEPMKSDYSIEEIIHNVF